ncbi:MAG TPA: RNA polymerase sigma-54 factor, partial [Pseudobdellovibrionaceae bacterium]|nr:RNA polymerase sigma-54 factor [Pseudobdellovibrionaceae bacterium]
MAMKQTMSLSQNLVITPQLQQAIKLLQMSRLELETAVRSELDENPVLEETVDLKEEDLKRTQEVEKELEVQSQGSETVQDPQKQDEFEWESYFELNQKPPQSQTTGNEEIMNYENVISTTQSLQDYLQWQVQMNGFSEKELLAAEAIIGAIDDDGYLKTTLDQISQEEEIPFEDLEDALAMIQEFDPPGVAARDLKECLLIQARSLEEDTNDLVQLINHHLKDLEKKNYPAIASAMGRDIEDVVEMCKIIYAMDPKPGRAFVSHHTQY